MIRVIIVYQPPKDAAAFDAYYAAVHVPLAAAMPELAGYEISHGPVLVSEGPTPHLVAILTYETEAAMQASFASPQGQAAIADVANFATGGCTITTLSTQSAL